MARHNASRRRREIKNHQLGGLPGLRPKVLRATKAMIRYTAAELREIHAERPDEMPWHVNKILEIQYIITGKPARQASAEKQIKDAKLKAGARQHDRPQCLQCAKLAYWDLDFCGSCLVAEARPRKLEEQERRAKEKERRAEEEKRRAEERVNRRVNVRTLELLGPTARGFCYATGVTATIMHSMLTRHGKQSRNPSFRQHDPSQGAE
ncbi:uncharacterized protein RCC_10073 [Ramularia collo-cygni]|uniref:Uncharacterized protein n=1 Tax=Ramularia collo-cygni TaxID=112498 RepID=A0A2D3VLA9_9PEZI|nr:uncharacterized protein RCC_10073 [Ramularia collo-cygni]CZT24349.1 uncharacterized protein RCC_10073 [Ramularia collo-cygni]